MDGREGTPVVENVWSVPETQSSEHESNADRNKCSRPHTQKKKHAGVKESADLDYSLSLLLTFKYRTRKIYISK